MNDIEENASTEEPKHPGGRPLKFENVGELERAISEYFVWAAENKRPLTIGRLCCFLDCDRDTLLNYQHKDEFFGTIKRAKRKIEADKEERLNSVQYVTGIIFDLKNNHGWKDQHDITSGGEPIKPQTVDFSSIVAAAATAANCPGAGGTLADDNAG